VINVTPPKRIELLQVLTEYKSVQARGTLLTLTFVTVNDYLWLLRAVSQELSVLKRKALFYLAAAVSDFFLPRQRMSEHKIQSGKGSLLIEMDQVPKILKPMVDEWTRDGYIVSFKLETDPNLIVPKARVALERYGHQIVIGNDLHTRKYQVVFVSKRQKRSKSIATTSANKVPSETDSASSGKNSEYEETWLRISDGLPPPGMKAKEIEEDIVAQLVERHKVWIENGNEKAPQ